METSMSACLPQFGEHPEHRGAGRCSDWLQGRPHLAQGMGWQDIVVHPAPSTQRGWGVTWTLCQGSLGGGRTPYSMVIPFPPVGLGGGWAWCQWHLKA